ncbi:unnamed protein product, partial [Thlaspi arvense]
PLQDLSYDDLLGADSALTYVRDSRFKESKLKFSFKEALFEKEKEELKNLKKKCSDIETWLEKEKAKVFAAPLTLDDVV